MTLLRYVARLGICLKKLINYNISREAVLPSHCAEDMDDG